MSAPTPYDGRFTCCTCLLEKQGGGTTFAVIDITMPAVTARGRIDNGVISLNPTEPTMVRGKAPVVVCARCVRSASRLVGEVNVVDAIPDGYTIIAKGFITNLADDSGALRWGVESLLSIIDGIPLDGTDQARVDDVRKLVTNPPARGTEKP